MTDLDPSRPVARPRARPAADEGHDPIVSAPLPAPTPATLTAAAPLPTRRKAEPTVQLGTRVAVSVDEILTAAAQRTGATKRDLIEHAIRTAYGTN